MDLNELKEIIKREGGKVIIVENDKPQIVIMSFDEWRRAERPASNVQNPTHEEQAPKSAPLQSGEERGEGLTIDDLPL